MGGIVQNTIVIAAALATIAGAVDNAGVHDVSQSPDKASASTHWSIDMASVPADHFAVFLRFDGSHNGSAVENAETPVAFCSTYEEARKIRQALQGSAVGDCVIRYEGSTGGGD
jgi:hypothetical protein